MFNAVCPACGEVFSLEKDTQAGQNRVCPNCQELLTVVTLDPLILELYQFTSPLMSWLDDDKKEAAKKHENKNKRRHENPLDYEDEEYWRKGKKKRNRSVGDW